MSATDPTTRPFIDLTPAEAARTAHAGRRLIDVREAHELDGDLGHVAGIEHVPLATVAAAAAGWDRDGELLVICRSGGRSSRAAALLASLGFRRVYNLAGGMLAWNAAGLPVRRRAA